MACNELDFECVPEAAVLSRFDQRYLGPLKECARVSVRVEQLASSFPFLFFALATRYGPLQARRDAINLAIEGSPLREVAAALKLPLCFRRIPAESCRINLPYAVWSQDASRQLAAFIPSDRHIAAAWLTGVSMGARYCDEPFAIWMARHRQLYEMRAIRRRSLFPLMLFAWHSRRQGDSDALWSARMGLSKSIETTLDWLHELQDSSVSCEARRAVDCWLGEGEVDGYRFLPLLTHAALREEAKVMHNCVRTYWSQLLQGDCRVFSVRHGERRVATLEVRRNQVRSCYTIAQLKACGNKSCGLEVWDAAGRWLGAAHCQAASVRKSPTTTRGKGLPDLLFDYRVERQIPHSVWFDSLSITRMIADVEELEALTT